MARITSQSLSVSPAVTEAGRQFQLPSRTEKRTQGSTMFSTTAKNLTSGIPFRWRADQVKIFEDWVLFKGPNVMSADLLPLLRALDLDGYEDVKNNRGECVHDLIIVKVRRKLTKTNNEMKSEIKAKRACDTSQSTQVRHKEPAVATSPRASLHESVEAGYDKHDVTLIKREQGDAFEPFEQIPRVVPYHSVTGSYRRPATRDKGHVPVLVPRTTDCQHISLEHASGKGIAPTVPTHPATLRRYGLRSQNAAGRDTTDEDLVADMDNLNAAMKKFLLTVGRLVANSSSANLQIAAHDAITEIDYLEALVKEYLNEEQD
ncbi:hypothetical protein FHL15_003023 [Xylaria flabelliformis]|uniref:Uncharacterized protein n=1 Tax=Xylaria flabelliformis TaxID=2512241 RepID=A0A553I6Q7_9PEZI|nr:hypothetical protein FHL15_003023 [Xylaria flabelliformis]